MSYYTTINSHSKSMNFEKFPKQMPIYSPLLLTEN